MLPVAAITCVVWPTIQHGIASIQYFIVASGYIGVWLYHFLERVLIPTGLHHFIYAPIEVGPVVVNHGLKAEWLQHLNQFAESNKPLKEQFPYGFMLQGNGKVFGCLGIALAMYATTPKENRKKVAALLIPATTAVSVAGINNAATFLRFSFGVVAYIANAIPRQPKTFPFPCNINPYGNCSLSGLLLSANWFKC
ncbi:PTS system, glucose-like IIB component [Mycobacteroides abscessus subsp. massiliense]|nr:PTS system, glucose-like IIB component [Mycobacteroides abscessus subsp. massiliense]